MRSHRYLARLAIVLVPAVGMMACGKRSPSADDGLDDAKAVAEPEPAPEQAPQIQPLEIEAPAGTVLVSDVQLLVQSCDEEHPCIDALHGAGADHCEGLELETFAAWRLPTREEVEHLAGKADLASLAGYHWTSSVDQANPSMYWIADPEGTQPTTLPPDRKPFRIRCVHPVGG